jgi:hypothetical protein
MEAPLIRNPCEKLIRADYMLKLFQQTSAHSGNGSQAKTPSRKTGRRFRSQPKEQDATMPLFHPTHLQYSPYPAPSVESG